MSERADRVCVHEESVSGLLDAALPAAELERVREHVAGCARCAAVLEQARGADAVFRRELAEWGGWGETDRDGFVARVQAAIDRAERDGSAPPNAAAPASPASSPARPPRAPSGRFSTGWLAAVAAAGIAAGFVLGGFFELRWRGEPSAPVGGVRFVGGGAGEPAGWAAGGLEGRVLPVVPGADESPLLRVGLLLDRLVALRERPDPEAWARLRAHVIESGLLAGVGEEKRRTLDPELRAYLERIELLLLRMINSEAEPGLGVDEVSGLAGALRAAGLRERFEDARAARRRGF